MRIAHIVRRYSRAEWGGTETVVWHTVEEQLARGHEPRIFATCALQPEVPQQEQSDAQLSTYPYFYPYWPMPAADRLALDKKGGSPYAPALFRAVRDFHPDLIHIHAGGRLAAAAVRLAERIGVPTVMSLHGGAAVVPQRELEEMLRPLKGKFPYGGILDRLSGLHFDPLRRVDAIVCISRAEERRLNEIYPGRKIRYVPNGVAAAPAVEPLDASAAPTILCVSRIDYQKNQLALVEALAKLPPPTRLVLVGPVTASWYCDRILTRVRELGLQDRFSLVRGLPPGSRELESAFAQASVFALPSVHEPFGIVALEAMQRGLPLVSSNVGGLPDFVVDGENGLLFDPADVDALARALGRVLNDASLALRLRAAGRVTAERFAWPRVIDDLDGVYAEVMAVGKVA
ncbi:MAG: glycosyltransferase family 4 protein [Kiritimatiellae bacterium]|nr:glycosyltransferase family 4 protein [Kiritimatiellia bacterium]